jgi:hypothetical protein
VKGITTISAKRGTQWNRWKIRVSGRLAGSKRKKYLQVIGTTMIRVKRGFQCDRS